MLCSCEFMFSCPPPPATFGVSSLPVNFQVSGTFFFFLLRVANSVSVTSPVTLPNAGGLGHHSSTQPHFILPVLVLVFDFVNYNNLEQHI